MRKRDAGGALGRRGLLAGAAALVAGGLTKLAGPGRAEAAHFGSDEAFIHAGEHNTTTDPTVISRDGANNPVLSVSMNTGTTLRLFADAIQGNLGASSDETSGVRGYAEALSGRTYGVVGHTSSTTTNASGVKGTAVRGVTNGVWGQNSSGDANATGVFGLALSTATQNPTVGVWGRSESPSTGAIGTFGESTKGSGVRGLSGDGNGVFGVSTNASGVYGFSGNSFGAAGVSNGGIGVYARSGSTWGLHAESPTFAGVFSGSVFINGSYTATGAKSAAVKNKRGEHRRMYCQESPEAWFEDFGEATLHANGVARVQLDPEFDEVVRGDDYQVFLTEYGDLGGLYVADRRPHAFMVRSRSGASGPFGYRVVARSRALDDGTLMRAHRRGAILDVHTCSG